VNWNALELSLALAFATGAVLIPLALIAARALAWGDFRGKTAVEAAIALPLVLPPTVLGYYLLVAMAGTAPLGQAYHLLTGRALVFSFDGLLLASIIVNLPFAVQPMQRAFEAVPPAVREAAWCSGLSPWRTFWRIELPLAWPGIVSALALTLAHTMGEFGVVLMVGGSIPGETLTMSIAIYDRVQALDGSGAGIMSAILLAVSFATIALVYALTGRRVRRHG
jgi:molybdate transport system permease protein